METYTEEIECGFELEMRTHTITIETDPQGNEMKIKECEQCHLRTHYDQVVNQED